jgi:DNA-binding winged helix-turn-helix (wHTH) protein/Flp pilus assembly protein TadD
MPVVEIRFGPFLLDAELARLMRDGAEIRLRPRAFHVLKVLLLHRGQPVGYERMLAEAWQGTYVSRHTVDVTVAEIRKALGEYGRWITRRAKIGYSLEVPASDDLVRKGWHFWSRRTREGVERAIECFRQAADECPADFQAYEGLSAAHLTLATFGMRPPREMYEGFLDAHNRAVALGGLRPELRCNIGYALYVFERRAAEAEHELLQVIREKPAVPASYVRLAMLYASRGRSDDALEIIRRGYDVDPLLPMMPTIEMTVRVWRREFGLAAEIGARAVELHPYVQIVRAIYGEALRFLGRGEEALAQYQRGSVMSPDLPWLRALEGATLAQLGRRAAACAILEELETIRRTDYVDAYHMTTLREALGDDEGALAELQRALVENSAWLYQIDVDPKMDRLRRDPRFARVREAVMLETAHA